MVFSSVIFLYLFLPVVLVCYFLIPKTFRNLFLLISSIVFYTWGEQWIVFVMFGSSVLDFICGWIIGREFDKYPDLGSKKRTITQKTALWTSVVLNLTALGIFKYFYFTIDNYNALVELLGLSSCAWRYTFTITLPLGISFYTFQSMSYTIDVYRGNAKATKHFVDFSCFVTMFPQLVAGPIVRYRDISEQLVKRTITVEKFASGISLFIVGLGKKVLIANVLSEPADRIFATPIDQLPLSVAWLGALLFPLQLFFDFSGYSDMAIGMGRMFGFNFPKNFNYPFICKNASDFWQRWHITLSTWLRDYVFTPLGGYRCSRNRAYFNLLFTFFLCGLWHGASWNFVLFGLIPGCFIVIERIIHSNRYRFFKTQWGSFYTIPMIFICMVIFRTETLPDAGNYLKALVNLNTNINPALNPGLFANPEVFLMIIAGLIGSVPFVPWLNEKLDILEQKAGIIYIIRQTGTIVILMAILLACSMKLAAGTYNPFIYFRF